MKNIIRSLATLSAVGTIGVMSASSVQAATTLAWKSTVTQGDWNIKSNWEGGTLPTTADTVKFTIANDVTVNCNMTITKVAGITKQAAGTLTLNNIPTSFKFGAHTQSNGKLVLNWAGDAPTNPLSSITIQGGSTLNLGGATQTLEGFPTFTDGKKFTLENGILSTGWKENQVFTITIGSGATWNLPRLRTFNYNATTKWTATTQTVNVKDGGVLQVSDESYLGDGMRESGKEQRLDINISNKGRARFASHLYLGRQGLATVTVTNGTLSVGGTIYGAKRYSPASRTINALSELYVADGSTLEADKILYGDSGGEDGCFTFNVSGNSKVYTRTLQGDGKSGVTGDSRINDIITLNGATFVPLSSELALFQGSEKIRNNYITIGTDGLTIDNERTNAVTIAEALTGTGPFAAKMYGADFTLNNAMTTTGGVSFEDPGLITLNCARQAFASGTTVAIKFNDRPMATNESERLLVDWHKNGRPDGVTFKLAADSIKGYELAEKSGGLFVLSDEAAVAVWQGGDDSDAYATTNWLFKSASDVTLTNGYIGDDTVFCYGGGQPRFNVTNGTALAGHVLLLTEDVTLPANRNWSGFDTVALADGVTLDEKTFMLSLSGNLSGSNATSRVENGKVSFNVASGTKTMDTMAVSNMTEIAKSGVGTLVVSNVIFETKPKLKLNAGKVAFDWSGQPVPESPLSSLSVTGTATLNLGGASQTADFPIADGKTFSLENGFLTTSWDSGNNDNPNRYFNIGKDAKWTVTEGLTARQVVYKGYVNGGVLTAQGTSVLGDWYRSREFHLFVNGGGTFNNTDGNLYLGKTGVGEIDLDNAMLNAAGKTIYACKKNTAGKTLSGKNYNSLSTLTLKNGSVLRAKKIEYGEDNDDGVGGFTFSASGGSTIYIESMAAVGNAGGSRTFNGATIVPLASGTLLQGSDKLNTKYITVNADGLTIDNQFTNNVTIAQELRGAGPVTFKLNGANLTVTEPLNVDVKFVNPGKVTFSGGGTLATGKTMTIAYTDKKFVKTGDIVTWSSKPNGIMVVLDDGTKTLVGKDLVVEDSGVSFAGEFLILVY